MRKIKLNTTALAIIAALIMLIDHIACFLVSPNVIAYFIMRIIGRMGLPLFLFLFVYSYKESSNKSQYMLELVFATCIMSLVNNILSVLSNRTLFISPIAPNLFVALLLSALIITCIEAMKSKHNIVFKILLFLCAILLSAVVIIATDNGIYTLVSVFVFYFINNRIAKYIVFVLANILFSLINMEMLQAFMVLSVFFFLFFKNEPQKNRTSALLYIFYPMHLWVIMIIAIML
jgi:hypothetical protein